MENGSSPLFASLVDKKIVGNKCKGAAQSQLSIHIVWVMSFDYTDLIRRVLFCTRTCFSVTSSHLCTTIKARWRAMTLWHEQGIAHSLVDHYMGSNANWGTSSCLPGEHTDWPSFTKYEPRGHWSRMAQQTLMKVWKGGRTNRRAGGRSGPTEWGDYGETCLWWSGPQSSLVRVELFQ